MSEKDYYSRQTILKDVTESGQKKLKDSRALVIGAGGLGHPVVAYIAAAGVGHISIYDFDNVEQSNLNRQIFFKNSDIGNNKAEILALRAREQNPYIDIENYSLRIDTSNVLSIINKFDIIIDCSDNFATKFLIHDACWYLKKKLVQSSLYQLEGQLQTFDYTNDPDRACLRCLWNETPRNNCIQNCSLSGVIGATAGVFGTLSAMETVKLLLGIGESLGPSTIIIDLMSLDKQKIKWKKNHHCSLCSKERNLFEIDLNNYFPVNEFEVISISSNYKIIDIREENEIANSDIFSKFDYQNIPLSSVECFSSLLSYDEKYLIVCSKGIRSYKLVKNLRAQNYENCFSLVNGLEGL